MTTPKIELVNISKSFHGDGKVVPAVDGINLSVQPGEFITILGPSGSGKSTLFNLIAGLLEPDTGEICINGNHCTDRIGMVGYMPQRDLLLPWRSVMDNVVLAQDVREVPREESYIRAQELLPLFGLEGFEQAYPSALSGGMRQRAALLRTLLTDRDILLLDEPFGALDALTRRELQDWLLEVWRHFSQTVVFVTHDVEEALYLGDRVIVLSARPGRVVHELKVELPRPRQPVMITLPDFAQQASVLLRALGVAI